jgi:hypothetical protein
MPSGVFDSILLKHLWGTEALRAEAILDRGHGKPVQALVHGSKAGGPIKAGSASCWSSRSHGEMSL